MSSSMSNDILGELRQIKEGLINYNPRSIEIKITRRINQNSKNPKFVDIGEKLTTLKEKFNQKLIDDGEYIKGLIELATQVVRKEKSVQPIDKKNALTRIFEKAKNPSKDIKSIVEKIDDIVTNQRYDGWQNTAHGTKLIQQKLYRVLYDHKLSDDEELYEKAYTYIQEHY